MCGRFAFTQKKESIKSRFNLSKIPEDVVFSYNIAPGQGVPSILNETPDCLTTLKWGLVPGWANDEKIGYKMINARAETIVEKPSFRKPIRSRRCLILADAFYEWKKEDGGKRPYRVYLKNEEVFAFAGIWDVWEKKGARLTTCSIITTVSNSFMMPLHDRMPVIVPEEFHQKWLQEKSLSEVTRLLRPFDSDKMEAHEISTLVNSPKNNSPEIIKPI